MRSGIVDFARLIRFVICSPKALFICFFFNSCSSSPPLSQPDKIVVKISPPLVVIFQHLIHFWRLIANDWDGWDQDLTTFDMFATHFFDKCLSNGIKLGLIFIWRIDYKTIRYFETILPFNTLTSCLFVFVYLSEICLNGSSDINIYRFNGGDDIIYKTKKTHFEICSITPHQPKKHASDRATAEWRLH